LRNKIKSAKSALLGAALVLIMVSAATATAVLEDSQARHNAGLNLVVVEGTNYVFKVTGMGNVPHYQFYEKTEPSTPSEGEESIQESEIPEPANIVYHVKFVQLIEFNDTNEDGKFDANEKVSGGGHQLALPSVKWDYTIDEGTKTFNFTAPEDSKPWIRLVNHYDTESLLKFDIELKDWNWIREDSELALRFDVTTDPEHAGAVTVTEVENGVRFEYDTEIAYFVSSLEATIDGTLTSDSVGVAVSLTEENNGARVYISYPHFKISVHHDPTIGFGELPGVSMFPTFQLILFFAVIATIGILSGWVIRRRS